MTIDIRATVTCSLGTLISASVSDDYVQGTGLIKCKGTCEISGIVTPAIGTVVTFSYTQNGVTRQVPRTLRVLSSFADPYRRKTSVSLGCKLTYLEDLKDPINYRIYDDPYYPLQLSEEEAKIITAPIYASSIMAKCLTELGITATSNPLTNRFSIYQFDLAAGYVSVLSDLLVSESYLGYLDANETLQVVSLDVDGGTGPVIDQSQIIDIGPINVGQLPGEAVTVSYSTLKLQKGVKDPKAKLWDTASSSTTSQIVIPYSSAQGQRFQEYNITETTNTTTNYEQKTLANLQVVNVVKSRHTIATTGSATVLGNAASDYLSNGIPFFNERITKDTSEFFYYDEFGNETFYIRSTLGSAAHIGGSVNVPQWVFDVPNSGKDPVYLNTTTDRLIDAEVRQTITAGNYQQVITKTYGPWSNTIAGQQANAFGAKNISTSADLRSHINNLLRTIGGYANSGLFLLSTNVATQSSTEGQVGPDGSLKIVSINSINGDPNNGFKVASKATIALALGSAAAQRRIEFSLPYAPDDYFFRYGTAPSFYFGSVSSDADAKARLYGRVQNKILMGNRNGMNIQVAASLLPAAPFSPFIVQANGLSALYRTNGINWQMDASGILVSTDALFWGAVGGTGQFWFPVAPTITTLPTTPPIVDGQMTVTNVVPVWNETLTVVAKTRTTLVVESFGYALTRQTSVTITTRTKLRAVTLIALPVPTAPSIGVAMLVPGIAIGAAVQVPPAVVTLTALTPEVNAGVGIYVPLSQIAVNGIVPLRIGSNSATVNVPVATIAISAKTPESIGVNTESYYDSWRLQNYGTDALVYPDWWAD